MDNLGILTKGNKNGCAKHTENTGQIELPKVNNPQWNLIHNKKLQICELTGSKKEENQYYNKRKIIERIGK